MHKKKLIFLVVIALLLCGCTKIGNDLDVIVNTVFTDNKTVVNTASTNYELYIPTNVKQESDSEYNQKFKIADRYVYLYVDTISYYYKNSLNYKGEDNYNYYFKKLNYNGKDGYVGIDKMDDGLYFTEIVYNYSKIEFYSDYENLPTIFANSLIIIKSIKYNDNLIKMALDSGYNDSREVKYQLDSPKDSESKFSDFLQEYVPEETEEVTLPEEE